ncbi:hypothetical protein WDU94_009985 [Cyamophila willieti]
MNDSTLSEYLLDINTGITYKVAEVNGVKYLYSASNVCNVLDVTGDNEHGLVVLSVSNLNSHSVQLSSNIIGFDSNNDHENNGSIIITGASGVEQSADEEVDTELDDIISFVQEDISHDKQIIESCGGKLPPVTGVTGDGGDDLYEQSAQLVVTATPPSHIVPEYTNEVNISSFHDDSHLDKVLSLSAGSKDNAEDERDEECQVEYEAIDHLMDLDEDLSDESSITAKININLKPNSGAQWGLSLDTVDENQVTLETREQIMSSVENKMMDRKKRDCTNLIEFESSKDKLTVFLCNSCNAVFDHISKYHGHLRKHTDEVVWKCRQCPSGFFKKSDLVAHLSIHLKLKKHLCDVCGKTFSQSSNLLAHKRSHTGSRPYPCKQCGRRFRQINALNVHRATHASGDQNTDESDSANKEFDLSSVRDRGCQCSECVQIYHNVYEFLSHSCISGEDPNSSSSLPNFTEDNSEELISLLNEILNTTSASSSGNKNEEILNILLNLSDENGTTTVGNSERVEEECAQGEIQSLVEGEVKSVREEVMCDTIQQVEYKCNTTPQMYSAPDKFDNLEMLPSGEMSAEQIFANISTSSLLPNCPTSSSNNFPNRSFIPSTRVSFVPLLGLDKCSTSGTSYTASSSLSNVPVSGNVGVVSSLLPIPNSNYPSATFVSSSSLRDSSDPSTPFPSPTPDPTTCNTTGTSTSYTTTKYFPPDDDISSSEFSSSVNYPNPITLSDNVIPNSTEPCSNDTGIANHGTPNHVFPIPTDSTGVVLAPSTASSHMSSSTTSPIFSSNIPSSSNLTFDPPANPSGLITSTTSPHCPPDMLSGSTPTVLSCSDLKKFPVRMIVNVDNVDRLKKMLETSPQGEETSLTRILVKLKQTKDMKGKSVNSTTATTDLDTSVEENKLGTNDPPCSTPNVTSIQTNPIKRKRLPLSISCNQCPATFTRWTTYRLHTSTVHNTNRMLYTCPDCGKSFSYENGLKTHMRNKHERTEEVKNKFTCQVESCDRLFTSINTLNTHVKRDHVKEKPHACAECGKCFFSKYDWKKHSRIHSGEKPFHCEHCPRQFRNSSHLFRHQRSLHSNQHQ